MAIVVGIMEVVSLVTWQPQCVIASLRVMAYMTVIVKAWLACFDV